MSGLNPPHSRGALVDHRIGQCKICRRGIYHGQDVVWLTDPLGLSHRDCAASPGGTT
jgi:hypothetical protein